MPFIPLPLGVKVCFRYSNDSQQICNVFYVTMPDPHTAADFATLGAALLGWWTANVQANLSDAVGLEAIEITDAEVAGGIGIEFTDSLPQAGIHGGDPLPGNVTYAVKLVSGLTGRSHRGRQYWPILTNTQKVSQNHVSTAFRLAATEAYQALITAVADAGAELIIASFFKDGAPRVTGVATPVTDATTSDDVTDSQRRRLPGRGA